MILQLNIRLKNTSPPVWRRVLVKNSINLWQLHLTIQLAMGWENKHLCEFDINRKTYSFDPDDLNFDDMFDGYKFTLEEISQTDKIRYWYDFGDDWYHDIKVEKILEPLPELSYPICIKGKLACPPEDCGGIYGYYELIEKQSGTSKTRFDQTYFNLEFVNKEFNKHRNIL